MPEGGCILRNQLQTEMKTSKNSDEASAYELLMFGGTVKLANNKYRKVQYNQLTGLLGFIETFEKIKITVFPSS